VKVGLFIPCYVDQFYPEVAKATLELLEKHGCDVEYPLNQTCCGQPLSNSGYHDQTESLQELFTENFSKYDYVVCPSGSCTLHVKSHLKSLNAPEEAQKLRGRSYELVEFLHDILKADIRASFAHRVGIHSSCHGLRGLRLASGSERTVDQYDKVRSLLSMVSDITLCDLTHSDECCGFGGTFAVKEPGISAKMGQDRLDDHEEHGVEVITGADMSCLMHLEGLARRQKRPVRFAHVAEILNSNS